MKSESILKDRVDAELDLRYMIYSVFKNWRRLLKITLVLTAIVTLVLAIVFIIELNDEEFMMDAMQDYNVDTAVYNSNGSAIRTDIKTLQNSLTEKETYNENSIIMQINPYNKAYAKAVYYIDTGYQIMPGSTYQDIDYSDRIINLYMTYLTGGKLYAELLNQMPELTEIQYITEILAVVADYNNDMISIDINNTSTDECQKMLDIIKVGMQDTYLLATSQISEHTLTEISEDLYTIVDLNLEALQSANIQAVTDIANSLDLKKEALAEWKGTQKPTWEYTPWETIKRIIKYSIFAAIISAVLGAVWLAIGSVTTDRIRNHEDLKAKLTLKILGTIPSTAKRDTILDKLANVIGGITMKSANQDRIIAITARSIMRVALAEGIGGKKIAIMGSVSTKDLAFITDGFNSALSRSENCFVLAGNPMLDETAIEEAETADCVVVVEKQDHSLYKDIVRECNRINSWDKKILGIVLLNADAA